MVGLKTHVSSPTLSAFAAFSIRQSIIYSATTFYAQNARSTSGGMIQAAPSSSKSARSVLDVRTVKTLFSRHLPP